MAIYYVNGGKINIPTHKRPFGKGSEGNLYLVNDKLYKIYNTDALNEGFGNKKIYHQSLLGLNEQFKKFILPESLIFDVNGNYVGYVTPLVGDKRKKKEGITSSSFDNFITNLKDIENEINLLSENRFLAIDVGYHNSIYSENDSNLYMIDPGRYHHQSFFSISDYTRRNKLMLDDYFLNMLEKEIIHFKLVPNRMAILLARMIAEERKDYKYSEYFEDIAEKEESIHEFLIKKGKNLCLK